MSQRREPAAQAHGNRDDAQPEVRIDIGELVLRGFTPAEPRRLAAAFREELARLLGQQGVPPAWRGGGAVDRLAGGSVWVATGAASVRVGRQIAAAVYSGLARREPAAAGQVG